MLHLIIYVIIAMVSMAAKDCVYTLLTIAEAKNWRHRAGLLNALGTPTSLIFYSFSGAELLHHGIWGWLCMLPIMAVDFFGASFWTKIGNKWKGEE